mgnify:CR=1 FL=1
MLKVLTACWHLKSTANLNSFVLGCFVDSGGIKCVIIMDIPNCMIAEEKTCLIVVVRVASLFSVTET